MHSEVRGCQQRDSNWLRPLNHTDLSRKQKFCAAVHVHVLWECGSGVIFCVKFVFWISDRTLWGFSPPCCLKLRETGCCSSVFMWSMIRVGVGRCSRFVRRQSGSVFVHLQSEMRKSNVYTSTFLHSAFPICCLKTFPQKRFVHSVWALGSVKLLLLVLELIERTEDKILSLSLFLFVFFYMAASSENTFFLETVVLFFCFPYRLKSSFVLHVCGVVWWTLLFLYLVSSFQCLALLWGRFCNFACFTNAS